MDAIADRYAELWRSIRNDGDMPRDPSEAMLFLDRVRAALDRQSATLDARADARIVANSFIVEAVAHEGDRTQILKLRHRDLGTHHALKTPTQTHDAVAAGLLLREARLMSAMRHPNIVSAEMVLRLSDGRPALVMEWMAGSVADILNGALSITGERLHGYARDMLSGLAAIHDAGMVHADISPRNLLLTAGDMPTLKIADFGIALEHGETHASLGLASAGSPGFGAPAGAADRAGDVRACGAVFALMLDRTANPEPHLTELCATLRNAPAGMSARAVLDALV
ncbi:protein kinase [Mesorhizobium sp. CAU 1732]|uniref:protein kinase domain-containing protein n=1 Tax=Mesorhizobium sp. CAU 1732 TaxID=3140358 RepID=UPI00326180D4